MKSIVKALTPSKDGFRGTSLEATCQMATAKTLNAPDPDLNAQVGVLACCFCDHVVSRKSQVRRTRLVAL